MNLRKRVKQLPMPCYLVIYGPSYPGYNSVHWTGAISSQAEAVRVIRGLGYQGLKDQLEITGVEYVGHGFSRGQDVQYEWDEVSV